MTKLIEIVKEVFNTLKTYLAIVTLVIGLIIGYLYASNKFDAELAVMRQAQSDAIISSQQQYQADYEKREKALLDQLIADRNANDERVRKLEAKLREHADVDTVRRERSRCLELVVEGTELVEEGRRIINADR